MNASLETEQPVVTYGLLILLVLVFVTQQALTGEGDSAPWLVNLGGFNKTLVHEGQWWRFATNSFLHVDSYHLLGNGVLLLWCGYLLERIVGHDWFAAIFAVSCAGSSLGSDLSAASFSVSVGASGGVMGLAAATVLLGLAHRGRYFRRSAALLLLLVLLPALVAPVWLPASDPTIDHAGHAGGAVGGVLAAVVILLAWSPHATMPPGATVAVVVAGLFAICTCIGMSRVIANRQDDVVRLVPTALIPEGDQEGATFLASQVTRYPDDPRTHANLGYQHARNGNLSAAKTELQQAMALAGPATLYLEPNFLAEAGASLADVLVKLGQVNEARQVVLPLCDMRAKEPALDKLIAKHPELCR